MSAPQLDEAHLVLIAATVCAAAPEDVLDSTDVAALSRVCAVIETCREALDVAATALVAIATERPFGADSNAVAWLACALVAPAEAARVSADRAEALELVWRAACGDATVEDVREQLASRRIRCPACRRTVGPHAPNARSSFRSDPVELVARCAAEHGAHGRFGQPLRVADPVEDSPWRPVVQNQLTGAMIVLADAAPLLLVPDDEGYLVSEPTFVAGDLVGDWGALVDHARVRTSVAADAVALGPDGSMIDWPRLEDVLQSAYATA